MRSNSDPKSDAKQDLPGVVRSLLAFKMSYCFRTNGGVRPPDCYALPTTSCVNSDHRYMKF